MFDLFKQDVQRWLGPRRAVDPAEVTLRKSINLLINSMSLRAMLWLRFGQWCRKKRIAGSTGLIMRHLYKRYGLEISPKVPIGGGLYIAHPVGTVVSAKKIGQNCSIIANVTIGMRNEWAFPTIGDNVFIGAGARVLGDIIIGDNAIIGANAVVINDVPAGATVVGIPARVVRRKEENVAPSAIADQTTAISPTSS